MSDLKDRLARLGLSQYHQVFAAEGFDTWDTLGDITESDLYAASVTLQVIKADNIKELSQRQAWTSKGTSLCVQYTNHTTTYQYGRNYNEPYLNHEDNHLIGHCHLLQEELIVLINPTEAMTPGLRAGASKESQL